MKSAEEWMRDAEAREIIKHQSDQSRKNMLFQFEQIQADAFKAGQEATMKWVGEECRRQTEKLIGLQQKTEPLF